jgi:hypothetical protein
VTPPKLPNLVRSHGADTRRSSATGAGADGRSKVSALSSRGESLRARSAGDTRRSDVRRGRGGLRARALVSRLELGGPRGCFCTSG